MIWGVIHCDSLCWFCWLLIGCSQTLFRANIIIPHGRQLLKGENGGAMHMDVVFGESLFAAESMSAHDIRMF